jgi:hypothetical protein
LKKLAAILLLALLLFNWYGYRIVSAYLLNRSDEKMEARVDSNDYDESQLVELRVPIHLPYHNDWSDWESYSGEIEIEGVHYNYVKRKVEKDELVLLCLPNTEKQMVQSARDNFFKLVNDLQQNNGSKKSDHGNSFAFKSLFAEYQQENNNWTIDHLDLLMSGAGSDEPSFVSSKFTVSPEQPPDQA